MSFDRSDRPRILAGVAALALQGLLGLALVIGLAVGVPVRIDRELRLIAILPDLPKPAPKPVAKPQRRSAEREAAAAPPNLRARATSVVAPPPVVPLVVPDPPLVAAPVAGVGADASAGAAMIPGPGSGAGGVGTGTGSGDAGDGDGGGGGTPSRWLRGGIGNADYPRAAYAAGVGGIVRIRLDVGANGRVTGCTVTESSGTADLDETTCRLLKKRLRYEPARDAAGRAVPDVEMGRQVWEVERR